MPVARRRAWVKFSRKVQTVAEKQVAPQFTVVRRSGTQGSAINAQQGTGIFTVLGGGSASQNNDDLTDLFTAAQNMGGTGGFLGAVPLAAIRLHVSGWYAQCVLANVLPTQANVDCYYWRCRKDVDKAVYPDMDQIITTGFLNLGQHATGSVANPSKLSIDVPGVTPFQNPLFSTCFQVYKKTRLSIKPGESATLELRSSRNYYRKAYYDVNYSFLRGCTEGVYFVTSGNPSNNAGQNYGQQSTLQIMVTVNYTWRRMAEDRMGGVAGTD